MNIENELTKAFDEIDPVLFDALAGDIELPSDVSSAERITKRIYGEEKITMNRSVKKKSTALIVALAAAMTFGITAGAYVFNHKMSIGSFFGGETASQLENRGLIGGQVVHGTHFDIAIDTVMSNGRNFCIVATAAPKDEYGRSFAADSSAAGRIDLAPTEQGDEMIKAVGACTGEENGMIVMTFESELCEYSENATLPLRLMINSPGEKNGETDAEFEVKIEKNFDNLHFVSGEGEKLELWDFGLRVTDVRFEDGVSNDGTISSCMQHIELEFADGSCTVLDNSSYSPDTDTLDISNISVSAGDGCIIEGSVSFGHLIDSGNVTAVTVCGKKFTVQ